MKVFLCCAGGMSTSMLANKMKSEAEKRNIDCEIEALSIAEFEQAIKDHDICLLAPQVKYKYDEFKLRANELNKGCELIDMINYGTLRGDNVLNQVLRIYNDL